MNPFPFTVPMMLFIFSGTLHITCHIFFSFLPSPTLQENLHLFLYLVSLSVTLELIFPQYSKTLFFKYNPNLVSCSERPHVITPVTAIRRDCFAQEFFYIFTDMSFLSISNGNSFNEFKISLKFMIYVLSSIIPYPILIIFILMPRIVLNKEVIFCLFYIQQ